MTHNTTIIFGTVKEPSFFPSFFFTHYIRREDGLHTHGCVEHPQTVRQQTCAKLRTETRSHTYAPVRIVPWLPKISDGRF